MVTLYLPATAQRLYFACGQPLDVVAVSQTTRRYVALGYSSAQSPQLVNDFGASFRQPELYQSCCYTDVTACYASAVWCGLPC